jgi:hypothetical protein
MKKELEGKYAVVTVVSSFKQRYIIPTEALQELNEDVDLDEELARVWAEEEVMSENVKEFSQNWLGETVIDVDLIKLEKALELMSKDNRYLTEGEIAWPIDKQIQYIREWKDKK